MGKIKKIILWVVGVVVLILAFLWFLGTYGYDIQNYFIRQKQIKIEAQIEENKAKILEAQKNDTYGGKTPEETLDLYISALKAGDIELASKYWEVSLEKPYLQEDELNGLKNLIKKKGDLGVLLKNMDNLYKSNLRKYSSENRYVITYKYLTKQNATSTMIYGGAEYAWQVPEGTEEEMSIVLRLNPYTKVWKIIQ